MRPFRPPLPQSPVAPYLVCLLLAAAACGGGEPASPDSSAGGAAPSAWFSEVDAGLGFVHVNGLTGEHHAAEIICGGGALLDADGDGDLDVYFAQGQLLGRPPDPGLTDRLYRNLLAETGELSFTDVSAEAGLTAPGLTTGYGCSAAAGDFDGDGHTDLYLGNLGANRLLRNRGDGSFEDRTAAAGVGDPGSALTLVPFDADRDGDLDLFVGNYVEFVFDDPPRCRDLAGAPDWCGPGSFEYQGDRFYRNRGDGTFEDDTAGAGLVAEPRPTLGAVAADLDGDRWPDLYVGNDDEANYLWLNLGDGSFREAGLMAGTAVNSAGETEASMGIDAGDFDNDGDLDLVLSHLDKETNTLYENRGGGLFADATSGSGLGAPSLAFTGFGLAWLDVDNDGWLDLPVVNGAVFKLPSLAAAGDPFPLHQTNQLFRNLGPGPDGSVRFADVTARAGAAFRRSETSRGLLAGDLDNDGDTDLVVLNNYGPARLLRNEVGQDNPWLGLRLVTGSPPRDALGALAHLRRRGAPDLVRRVHTDGSFASAGDPRVLFGLGGGDDLKTLEVTWPDGRRERFPPPRAGRYTTVIQGSGQPLAGEAP